MTNGWFTLDVFHQRAADGHLQSEEGRTVAGTLAEQLRAAAAKAGITVWGDAREQIGNAVRAWLVSNGLTARQAGAMPVVAIVERLKDNRPSQTETIRTEPPQESESPKPVKQPTAIQFKMYHALQGGLTQEQVANHVSKVERKPYDQSAVSRAKTAVEAWIEAGNPIPAVASPPVLTEQPVTMDPDDLDMGARQDHRTPRQRGKRIEDPDSGWDD